MGEVAINQTAPQQLIFGAAQAITFKENEAVTYSYPSNGESMHLEEAKDNTKAAESLEKGYMQYG